MFTDNTGIFLEELEKKLEVALEDIGIMLESEAQKNLTQMGAVDTGLLRNSITHAIGGQAPAISSYSADRDSKYGGGMPESGSYSGTVQKKGDGSVSVGTNVEYGKYIEFGARGRAERPYLRRAFSENLDKIKEKLENALKE